MKNFYKQDMRDILNHILTICEIYECSSDKVARITQYTKGKLKELGDKNKKKGVLKDAKR